MKDLAQLITSMVVCFRLRMSPMATAPSTSRSTMMGLTRNRTLDASTSQSRKTAKKFTSELKLFGICSAVVVNQ